MLEQAALVGARIVLVEVAVVWAHPLTEVCMFQRALHEASASLGDRRRTHYQSSELSGKGLMGLQTRQSAAIGECSIDLAVEALLGCWVVILPG